MRNSADFNNQHAFEEYLRGYRILRTFFAEHLWFRALDMKVKCIMWYCEVLENGCCSLGFSASEERLLLTSCKIGYWVKHSHTSILIRLRARRQNLHLINIDIKCHSPSCHVGTSTKTKALRRPAKHRIHQNIHHFPSVASQSCKLSSSRLEALHKWRWFDLVLWWQVGIAGGRFLALRRTRVLLVLWDG